MPTPSVLHKTHASTETNGMEFILSDATPDRYGDVIAVDGWDLKNFSKNPIALFNHNPDFPVGRWENLSMKGSALRGHLRLAPAGTSARHDEIRQLVDAGILRAVSVGFRPIESKPRQTKNGISGEHYTKSELVETSLVSVPANPNALAVAKALKISADTLDLVFAKHGNGDDVTQRRGFSGENAESTHRMKGRTMSPIAKRIEDTQARIVALKDDLTKVLSEIDDENPDEAKSIILEELTSKIEVQEKSLETLKRAESHLASTAERKTEVTHYDNGASSALEVRSARPFAVAARKVKSEEYIWRALTVQVKHHTEHAKRPIIDVLKDTYGECEPTRAVMNVLTRTAAVPATTTTTGWAAELVTTAISEFMDALTPVSIYAGLRAKGASFTFGRNGIVSMPRRDATPTVAGGFVLQGSPIPVKQAAFSAITMTPKKMAVISTFTREIAEHSTPAIEALIRQAIIDDTAVAIDTVLLDAAAATATRPAGLLNGVVKTVVTAGGGIAALIGDMKSLTTALLANTAGGMRAPVWVMSPGDALAISLTQAAAGGDLPFRDELARGTLLGFPVIQSTNATADTIYLIDAADFVTATGDTPNFSVSDQATLHMEDTTPLALGTAGTPNVVAAPVRSLWQTDSLGIRMLLDMNWGLRRTGMVVWTDTMTWN